MDERLKKVFHASLARCNQQGNFFERFYEIFVDSSAEVREVFKNTDMKKQTKMLRDSFYTTKLANSDSAIIKDNLKKIALAHSKMGPGVRPELFDLWLQSLIKTVVEYDAQYDMEIAAAWKAMMRPGIEYLKAHVEGGEGLENKESTEELQQGEITLAALSKS